MTKIEGHHEAHCAPGTGDETQRSTPAMTVTFCNWCLDPQSPDPQLHPGGTAEHRPQRVVQLEASVKEWSDLAYELYALACNSTTDGTSTEAVWRAAFERLRDRFHAALANEDGCH